jgi:hypothetical protein
VATNPIFQCDTAVVLPQCAGDVIVNSDGSTIDCAASGNVCCDVPVVAAPTCLSSCPTACAINCSSLTHLTVQPSNSVFVTTQCADPDGATCNCIYNTDFNCVGAYHKSGDGSSCEADCPVLCNDIVKTVPANAHTTTWTPCATGASLKKNCDPAVTTAWACDTVPVPYHLNLAGDGCDPDVACTQLLWKTVLSGNSVTAWKDALLPFGSTCVSETRSCNNGSLSGSYTNQSCAIGCQVQTLLHCAMTAKDSGVTDGACEGGYAGACSYTCNNGVWGTPGPNSCTFVQCYSDAGCHETPTDNPCTTDTCNNPGLATAACSRVNNALTAACTATFGTCSVGGTKTCSGGSYGACVATDPRTANCSGKACGSDGCGGVCGTCSGGTPVCNAGVCQACTSGATTASGCIQLGSCSGAVQTCVAGVWNGICTKTPGTEICGNSVDEDCSGADLACPTCSCADTDGDGHYAIACADALCSPRDDCDNNNVNRYPGKAEVCGNGVDEDCSGADLGVNITICTKWDCKAFKDYCGRTYKTYQVQMDASLLTGDPGYTALGPNPDACTSSALYTMGHDASCWDPLDGWGIYDMGRNCVATRTYCTLQGTGGTDLLWNLSNQGNLLAESPHNHPLNVSTYMWPLQSRCVQNGDCVATCSCPATGCASSSGSWPPMPACAPCGSLGIKEYGYSEANLCSGLGTSQATFSKCTSIGIGCVLSPDPGCNGTINYPFMSDGGTLYNLNSGTVIGYTGNSC